MLELSRGQDSLLKNKVKCYLCCGGITVVLINASVYAEVAYRAWM